MFTHSLGMSTEIIRISHQIKKCIHRFTAAGAPTGCKSLRVKKISAENSKTHFGLGNSDADELLQYFLGKN